MIDNLKDAIEHATRVARNLKAEAKAWKGCAIQSKGKVKANECLECAADHERLAAWLTELQERRKTEPIVYEVTEDSQAFIVETNDDRNIGLKKVRTSNLIYAMREITEKYWDEGLRVVFKYYCGNGDEWQKCYESEGE